MNFKDSAVQDVTALPEVEPITLENLDRLQLLAQWGYGTLYDVQLTADETQVVAATATGFYWFDAVTLEVVDFVPYVFDVDYSSIQLSPTTKVAVFIDDEYRYLHFVDPPTGEVLYVVEEFCERMIWFSPDGNFVYGLAPNKVWNVFEHEWEDQEFPVFDDIEFSADDENYVTKSEGRMYYHSPGGERVEITAFQFMLWDKFDFSADGRYIAVGGDIGLTVKVWDTVEKTMVFERCLEENCCYDFPEGSVSGGKQARENLASGPPPGIYGLSFTPNGKYLIILGPEGYSRETTILYRFNLESNVLVMREELPKGGGMILPFSNSRRYITWSGTSIQSRTVYDSGVQAFINNDYNILDLPAEESISAYTDYDGIFHVVDNSTGEEIRQKWFDYDYSLFEVFHHSPVIVFGSKDNGNPPMLWNYKTDEIILLPGTEWNGAVTDLAVSSDDELIYYCEWDVPCYLVSVKTGKVMEVGWDGFAFHPEESRLIYNDAEKDTYIVAIYDEDLNLIPEFMLDGYAGYGYPINGENTIGFMPDSTEIFSIAQKGLMIYSKDGTSINYPIDVGFYSGNLYPIGFADDNSLYITFESEDLRFFDLNHGNFAATLITPTEICQGTLIADGDYILTYGVDGVYLLWGIPAEH